MRLLRSYRELLSSDFAKAKVHNPLNQADASLIRSIVWTFPFWSAKFISPSFSIPHCYLTRNKFRTPTLPNVQAIVRSQIISKAAALYVARGDLYYVQRVFELAKYNYEEALKLNPRLTKLNCKILEIDIRLCIQNNDCGKYTGLRIPDCGFKKIN